MDDIVNEPKLDQNIEEPAAADPDGDSNVQQFLASADAAEREKYLRDLVRTHAADILKTPITDDSNFLENGINSLTALELAKTLINVVGIEIPMVAIVENPTPAQLGRYLSEEFAAEQHSVGFDGK